MFGTPCPGMKSALERSDPDVVTAVTRSTDLLGEGRGAPPAPRAPPHATTAVCSGRFNTATARTDRVDVDALLIRPDGCVARALPTRQPSTPPRWCVR
jgi:hypothetical protein